MRTWLALARDSAKCCLHNTWWMIGGGHARAHRDLAAACRAEPGAAAAQLEAMRARPQRHLAAVPDGDE